MPGHHHPDNSLFILLPPWKIIGVRKQVALKTVCLYSHFPQKLRIICQGKKFGPVNPAFSFQNICNFWHFCAFRHGYRPIKHFAFLEKINDCNRFFTCFKTVFSGPKFCCCPCQYDQHGKAAIIHDDFVIGKNMFYFRYSGTDRDNDVYVAIRGGGGWTNCVYSDPQEPQ